MSQMGRESRRLFPPSLPSSTPNPSLKRGHSMCNRESWKQHKKGRTCVTSPRRRKRRRRRRGFAWAVTQKGGRSVKRPTIITLPGNKILDLASPHPLRQKKTSWLFFWREALKICARIPVRERKYPLCSSKRERNFLSERLRSGHNFLTGWIRFRRSQKRKREKKMREEEEEEEVEGVETPPPTKENAALFSTTFFRGGWGWGHFPKFRFDFFRGKEKLCWQTVKSRFLSQKECADVDDSFFS